MKVEAHIPTQQFGYIAVTGEITDLPEIERLYNVYAEKPINFGNDRGVLLEGFVGGSIWYNDATHTYTNDKGEVYLSSSQHARTFAKPFDKPKIAEAMAKKYNVNVIDIIAMWDLKAKISMDSGTVLHEAIELKRRFKALGEALGTNKHIHLSPMVKDAVEGLEKLLPIGNEVIEAVVIDHDNKRVGRVDLINIVGDHICEVIDYKTGELEGREKQYAEQLKFTSDILTKHGWTVSKQRLFHWDGSWSEH